MKPITVSRRKIFNNPSTPLPLLLGAIVAIGLLCPNAFAQRAAQTPEAFTVELNISIAAENLLKMARMLAGDGAYDDATNLYLEAVQSGRHSVTEVQPNYFLPIWRVLIEESAAWPQEARMQLARTITLAAAGSIERARSTANLADLEAAVQQYFLSESGASAAVLLADRFREKGWPALALYYYRLVLDRHPLSDVPRQQLLIRAALAARAAGLDDAAREAAAELREANLQMNVGGQAMPMTAWLQKIADQVPNHGSHSAGHGNVSQTPAQPPAVILWESQIAASRQQQHYGYQNVTLNTPVAYPTAADGVMYVANGHLIWAYEAAGGELKWKFSTRQRDDATLPPFVQSQAVQPLVSDGVVYVALQGEGTGLQHRGFGAATSLPTELYALSTSDGRLLWKWDPRKAGLEYGELNVDGQPIVTGDVVVVSLNASSAFFGEIHIAGLSRADGSLLWSRPVAGYTQGMVTRASPQMYSASTQIISNSLAARGGMVFANGLGVTAAHSAGNGSILWARSMQGMMQAQGSPAPKESSIKENLADDMALSRMPRLLIGRNNILTGCILSKNLESYHWLDGRLLWTRDAAGARHPVALTTDGHAVLWGSHVALISMDSGEHKWTPYKPSSSIIGEPIVSDQQIILPLHQSVLTLDLKTGLMLNDSTLPPDVSGGNLALSPAGLIIVNHEGALNFLDWQTAHARFVALANDQPDNPHPLLVLGQAALRLGKTQEGIEFLDQALRRTMDETQQILLYYLYEYAYRSSPSAAGDKYLLSLLDRMQEACGPTNTIGRNGFLRAEFFATRDPRQSIAALQSVLDVDRTRDVIISGIVGTGISSVMAEEAIARYIDRYGRQIYQPWEQLATSARQAALETADYDAMLNVALQYPNSLSARMALDDALALAITRPDLNEADKLLLRISAVTADPARHARYRAMLAETSRQLGNHTFASLQIAALADLPTDGQHVFVPGGKRVPITDILKAAPPHQPQAPTPDPEPTNVPEPPYRKLWEFDYQKWGVPRQLNVNDGRSPEKRAAGTIIVVTDRSLITIVPQTGEADWGIPFKGSRGGQAYVFDNTIYVAEGDEIRRLDPANGETIWRIKLRSSSAAGNSPTPATLIGGLCYGQSGVEPSQENITQIDDIGGYIIAAGRRFSYLIDARDGYIVQSIGSGTNQYAGFIRHNDRMITMATNNNVASGIQHWSIAGGRLLKEVQFPEQLRILRQTMPMSRLVPVMRVSQQGQATLLDLENGTTLGWFAAGGNVHQGNCHILSDIVVLPITNQIVGAYRISTLAPDAQQNKPIWTVNLPTNTYIHQINPLGDKALVIYYNGGMTVVDATSGKELWNLTTPDRNGSFSQIHGNADKVIIMRTLHRPGQFTRFVSINDSSTGKELFRFEGDQQTYVTVAMLPGHPGMFVTRNHRDLEYWIHDPAGPITFDAEAVARKEAEARRKAAEENTNQRNQ